MDFWEGRKAIITGANGFLGSWLSKELTERGCKVIGILQEKEKTRSLKNLGIEKKIAIEEADIRNPEAIEKIFLRHKADYCFHLAANAMASSGVPESLFFDSNVKGSYNVLSACAKAKAKGIVLASTAMAYGYYAEKGENEGEDSGLFSGNAYAFSKICMEKIADAFVEAAGLNAVSLRTSNIYGGNDSNFGRVVPSAIRSLLQAKRPVVHNRGNDEIDLVYVKDAVRAYLLAAENVGKIKGEKITVCSGRSIKVIGLVKEIIKISGREIEPEFAERKHGSRKTRLSNSTAGRLLGWRPEYTMKEGLNETYEFYKKYLKQ